MKELNKHLRASARVMKLIGWGTIVGGPVAFLAYAPGFFWGALPPGFPILGPAHPPSPYDGAHPYVYMVVVLYMAWAILLVHGAKDPKAAASLFDWGILANVLHGSLMVIQAFIYPNEHAHMWGDIPMLLGVSVVMWVWHPNRKISDEANN